MDGVALLLLLALVLELRLVRHVLAQSGVAGRALASVRVAVELGARGSGGIARTCSAQRGSSGIQKRIFSDELCQARQCIKQSKHDLRIKNKSRLRCTPP